MDETTSQVKQRIYTVGHSNHPLDKFIHLLRTHRVEVLIDTRSHPSSRYASHFSLDCLQRMILDVGISYIFLGKELGGRPEGSEFYDEEGHVLYWRRANSEDFKAGIRRVEEEAKKHCVAILCSEENPMHCHRRRLVGRVLYNHGIALEHIRGNGSLQTEEDLQGQMVLFGGTEREVWRSTQSVLQKDQQPISSEL